MDIASFPVLVLSHLIITSQERQVKAFLLYKVIFPNSFICIYRGGECEMSVEIQIQLLKQPPAKNEHPLIDACSALEKKIFPKHERFVTMERSGSRL